MDKSASKADSAVGREKTVNLTSGKNKLEFLLRAPREKNTLL